jgi:L-amino acid N-acyltransferase YncA
MTEYAIDNMAASDFQQVRSIYLEGIATGDATFETDAPEWDEWDKAHMEFGRVVARSGAVILGWAALSPVSSRCVYAGVAEVSVYVAEASRGKGVGRALLEALIEPSEANQIWTLQAGILAENTASLELHKRCGFREVGRRERLGKLGTRWRDVILLERRSPVVGVT